MTERHIVWMRRMLTALGATFAGMFTACGSENLIPPPPVNPSELYWELVLNHRAVALATADPYDTLQLVATPRNFRGDALLGLPAPEFRSSDPEKVAVTPEGLLVANSRTMQPVWVYATLTTGNIKHTDAVLVNVVDTATPPLLTSFSIHPLPPDSAKIGVVTPPFFNALRDTLPVRAVDANGARIPVLFRDSAGILPVDFRSADTNTARVSYDLQGGVGGLVAGMRIGTVAIYGTTTAFGVSMIDTLMYRVGLPVYSGIYVRRPAGPAGVLPGSSMYIDAPEVRVGVGAAVLWGIGASYNTDTVDITFADAGVENVKAIRPIVARLAAASSSFPFLYCTYDCDNDGSFMLFQSRWFVGRYFPMPGTYEYQSTRMGLKGRVVVIAE